MTSHLLRQILLVVRQHSLEHICARVVDYQRHAFLFAVLVDSSLELKFFSHLIKFRCVLTTLFVSCCSRRLFKLAHLHVLRMLEEQLVVVLDPIALLHVRDEHGAIPADASQLGLLDAQSRLLLFIYVHLTSLSVFIYN